jgi:hypothetical protein
MALASGMGCAVQPASNEEVDPQDRIAETTAALQDALTAQFVQGTIDPAALARPIEGVLQSFPEEARPEVQSHVQAALDDATELASRMSPEQRADVAGHPEHVDSVSEAYWRRPGWRPGWGAGWRWGRGGICGLNNPWCRRGGWHW